MPPSIKLLLAGPIGSGKSTVGSMLAARGFEVVDADQVGHEVIAPGGLAYKAVAESFPEAVQDGVIDRALLAAIVFNDGDALLRLERLTHPHIRGLILERVAASPAPAIAVEVPFARDFLGRGWERVLVDTPEAVRRERLHQRGMGEVAIQARILAQPLDDEWRDWADRSVSNAGHLGQLSDAVERLVAGIQKRQLFRSVGLLFGVGALFMALFETIGWSWFQYDVIEYRQHAAAWASGAMPYFERDLDLLPLAIVPMFATWILGGFASEVVYRIVFGVLMLSALGGVQWQLHRFGSAMPDSIGSPERFLWMVTPILPVVMFRHDALAVLLAVGGVLAIVNGHRGAGAALVSGTWTKGWPILLSAVSWWRGRRREALVVFGIGAAGLVGVAALPGFRRPRAFSGTHIETLSGSLSAFMDSVGGEALDIVSSAGSIYVDSDVILVILQMGVGLALGISVLATMRRTDGAWPEVMLGVAALVGALLIASPLFSSQFLLWMIPFLALGSSKRIQTEVVAMGVLTVAGVTFGLREITGGQNPLIFSSLLLIRNLVLVALVVRFIAVLRQASQSRA